LIVAEVIEQIDRLVDLVVDLLGDPLGQFVQAWRLTGIFAGVASSGVSHELLMEAVDPPVSGLHRAPVKEPHRTYRGCHGSLALEEISCRV
jgi:hypothetical protein